MLSFRTKKIIIVVLFLAAVSAIAFLLYATFFKQSTVPYSSPAISDNSYDTKTNLPLSGTATSREAEKEKDGIAFPVTTVAVGGPTKVTNLTLTGVSSPKLSSDGSSVNYYDPHDGKFYSVDAKGNARAILGDAFPNAKNIEWSQTASKAIVEFPDGANIVVDMQSGKSVTLPQHWEEFEFAPNNSDQIIAKSVGVDPGNRWLVIANADGSQAKTIAALGNNQDKVQVSWSPNDQVVAFSDTGAIVSGFSRKQILPIGKNEENLPGLIVEGFDFTPLWSTNGKQILYSTAGSSSNYLPQLWLVDGESNTMGQNRRSLPINTWADKCTYADSGTAYCAVPKEMPQGSGLQRSLAINEPDKIYKINTQTGVSTLVGEPETDTTMTNLNVSADGSVLFYQDAKSGTLRFLRLK